MNKKIMVLALIFMIVPAVGFSTESNIVNDFVTLDKAYVPALFLTNMKKPEPSKESMRRLHRVWGSFYTRYYIFNNNDPQWKKDFDKIDRKIKEATQVVFANDGDLIEAHETLETVRYTLIDTRRRHNIDYFIDYLTDFHDPMEHIVLRAKGKTPQTLTGEDIAYIDKTLPHTMALWDKIVNADFDKALFGFKQDKLDQMQATMQAETQALEDLKTALSDNAAKDMVIKKAMGIKKNFAQLFSMFGDFQGLK